VNAANKSTSTTAYHTHSYFSFHSFEDCVLGRLHLGAKLGISPDFSCTQAVRLVDFLKYMANS
jgi:hypothetical protein